MLRGLILYEAALARLGDDGQRAIDPIVYAEVSVASSESRTWTERYRRIRSPGTRARS